MAIHCSTLAWRIPQTEAPGGYSPWGHKESDAAERLSLRGYRICFLLLCNKLHSKYTIRK